MISRTPALHPLSSSIFPFLILLIFLAFNQSVYSIRPPVRNFKSPLAFYQPLSILDREFLDPNDAAKNQPRPSFPNDQPSPSNSSMPNSATFRQYIDHYDPSRGYFDQMYYFSTKHYKGPGSPIVFFTPGENPASGFLAYLTDDFITGALAKRLGAAIVICEHRYWGKSSPYSILSTENLQLLTVEQAIFDFVRFARNVQFPFDPARESRPSRAPWIFVGISYSGSLASWTQSTNPGTFWAYLSISAPLQALDYWQYFTPIMQGMPRNCSHDIVRVIEHVDHVGRTGSAAEKLALKTQFGFAELSQYSDFASALQGPLYMWQNTRFFGENPFYKFCDAIEGVYDYLDVTTHSAPISPTGREMPNLPNANVTVNSSSPPLNNTWSTSVTQATLPLSQLPLGNTSLPNGSSNSLGLDISATAVLPGPDGVGLERALKGYAAYMSKSWIPNICSAYGYPEWQNPFSVACYDTYNSTSPIFTDKSVNAPASRQWIWLVCNEPLGFLGGSAPPGLPSLVSRLINQDYIKHICDMYFPPEGEFSYGLRNGRSYQELNEFTNGWLIDEEKTRHTVYSNGELDPWRQASVSSDFRGNGRLKSTPQIPVNVIPNATHCADTFLLNALFNEGTKRVFDFNINQIEAWTKDWVNRGSLDIPYLKPDQDLADGSSDSVLPIPPPNFSDDDEYYFTRKNPSIPLRVNLPR